MTTLPQVPFNRPSRAPRTAAYLEDVLASVHHHGDGAFTLRCRQWLQQSTGCPAVLLTPSCTAALEMAAILAEVGPGDEVIMPSFTFVSTANAFVLRGAAPVFVDIEPDTLNISPAAIAAAMTDRTKVVAVVHYGGIGCDMEAIIALARPRGVLVVEDAAQAILARRNSRALGTFGDLGALSFHDTKNVSCGEGGALLINTPRMIERAEVIREKGTNRLSFLRGEAGKYTWVDLGSSFLPSEITAAVLLAGLENSDAVTQRRLAVWAAYHDAFAPHEAAGLLRRPVVPEGCAPNGHLYYLMLADPAARDALMTATRQAGVQTPFHYVPLHSSPAGQRFGKAVGSLANTDRAGSCLVRLPLWADMPSETVARVIDVVSSAITAKRITGEPSAGA